MGSLILRNNSSTKQVVCLCLLNHADCWLPSLNGTGYHHQCLHSWFVQFDRIKYFPYKLTSILHGKNQNRPVMCRRYTVCPHVQNQNQKHYFSTADSNANHFPINDGLSSVQSKQFGPETREDGKDWSNRFLSRVFLEKARLVVTPQIILRYSIKKYGTS